MEVANRWVFLCEYRRCIQGREGGIGVIIRVKKGGFVTVMVENLVGVTGAAHAKVLAIWKDIEFAKKYALSNIWIESNYAPIVRRIKEEKEVPLSIGTYYKNCPR